MRAELGYVTETKFSAWAWGSLTETWQHNAAVSEIQFFPLWSIDIIKHINGSEMPPRGIL